MEMPKFENSLWADSEFSQNYRDDASIFLPFRSQFFKTAKSLYAHFVDTNDKARVLDLGCGDGLFIQELLESFSPASVTLVDGSAEMLDEAKKRLETRENINFIQASFQNIADEKMVVGNFDFIHSSLAIHHLPFEAKKKLYA